MAETQSTNILAETTEIEPAVLMEETGGQVALAVMLDLFGMPFRQPMPGFGNTPSNIPLASDEINAAEFSGVMR